MERMTPLFRANRKIGFFQLKKANFTEDKRKDIKDNCLHIMPTVNKVIFMRMSLMENLWNLIKMVNSGSRMEYTGRKKIAI